jgi:hypothetical protein
MKFEHHLRVLASVAVLSIGCGQASIGGARDDRDVESGADAGPDDDDADEPDAGGYDDVEDPAEVACGVKADLGALGAVTGSAVSEIGAAVAGESIYFGAAINATAPIDQLQFDLYEDYGPFDGGIHTGSFPITGDDADPLACGACLYVAANVGSGGPEKLYFARSGTLNITVINTTISGTVSNASFVEIDIETGSILPSTCKTKVASASFSGTLAYP